MFACFGYDFGLSWDMFGILLGFMVASRPATKGPQKLSIRLSPDFCLGTPPEKPSGKRF